MHDRVCYCIPVVMVAWWGETVVAGMVAALVVALVAMLVSGGNSDAMWDVPQGSMKAVV